MITEKDPSKEQAASFLEIELPKPKPGESDDPRYLERCIQIITNKLKIYFDQKKLYPPFVVKHQKDNQGHLFQIFLKETGEQVTQIRNIAFPQENALTLSIFIAVEIINSDAKNHVINKTSIEQIQNFKKNVEWINHFFYGALSISGTRTELVPPEILLSPLMVWWVEKTVSSLPGEINSINARSVLLGKNENSINNILIVSYLLGYLDPAHPLSVKCKKYLEPLLTKNTPKIIQEAFSLLPNVDNLDSPRLQALKKIWPENFLAAWYTAAKVGENYGLKSLSLPDYQIAMGKASVTDNRSADTTSGVRNIAITATRRGAIDNPIDLLTAEQREQNKLISLAQQKRIDLLQTTGRLIQMYNPENKYFVDDLGLPVKEWSKFKKKIGFILATVSKSTAQIERPNLSAIEIETILSDTVEALETALITGDNDNSLQPINLFGEGYSDLANIEKVSLVTMVALSLARTQDKPNLAVHLVSNRLQALLIQHHDIKNTENNNENDVDWTYDQSKYLALSKRAKQNLAVLGPNDGIASTKLREVNDELDIRLAFMDLHSDSNLQTAFNQLARIGALSASFQISSFMVISLFSGKIDSQSFTYMSLANSMLMIAFYNFVSKKFQRLCDMNDQADTLAKLSIINNDFVETSLAIEKRTHENNEIARKRFALICILIIFFLPMLGGIGRGSRELIDLFFATGETSENDENNSGEITDLTIPDFLDQETLRNTPHKVRGQILHLPDDFSNQRGVVVGYLPALIESVDGDLPLLPTLNSQIQTAAEIKNENELEQLTISSEEFAYIPSTTNRIIYPMDGYTVDRLYYFLDENSNGLTYAVDSLGRALLFGDELPEDVVVVERPVRLNVLDSNGRVIQNTEAHFSTYEPWSDNDFDLEKAWELNEKLVGNPDLQALHAQMIQAANNILYNYDPSLSKQYEEEFTSLAVEFTGHYAAWTDSTEYFSLLFRYEAEGDNAPTLQAIANDDRRAYYCQVAQHAYAEFMGSVGIRVLLKPGEEVRNYDGQLMSRIGHVNSYLFAPDGSVYYVDMTPNQPYPGENFSVIEEYPPEMDLISEAEDDKNTPNVIPFLFSLGLALGTTKLVFESKKVKKRKEGKFSRVINERLPNIGHWNTRVLNSLNNILFGILQALEIYPSKENLPTEPLIGTSLNPDLNTFISHLVSDQLLLLQQEKLNQRSSDLFKFQRIILSGKSVRNDKDENLDIFLSREQKNQVRNAIKTAIKEIALQKSMLIDKCKEEISDLERNDEMESLPAKTQKLLSYQKSCDSIEQILKLLIS